MSAAERLEPAGDWPDDVLEWQSDIGGAMAVEFSRTVVGHDEVSFVQQTVDEITEFANQHHLALEATDANGQAGDKLIGFLHALEQLGQVALGPPPDDQPATVGKPLYCKAVGLDLRRLDLEGARRRVAEVVRTKTMTGDRTDLYYQGIAKALGGIVDAVERTLQTSAIDALQQSRSMPEMLDFASLLFVAADGPSSERLDEALGGIAGPNLSEQLTNRDLVERNDALNLRLTSSGRAAVEKHLPVPPVG